MALTATSTHSTFKAVRKRLSMNNPELIGCPLNRANIMYQVKQLMDTETFCSQIAAEVKLLGLRYPKTLIFIQSYSDCALLYHTLRIQLGGSITYPPDYQWRS